MSTNLYWLPSLPKKGHSLPDALKFALREEYGYPVQTDFTAGSIGFVRGLMAAKVDGSRDLLDAIETYDVVRVWED